MSSHTETRSTERQLYPRPPLPITKANPRIKELNPAHLPPIKYQQINTNGIMTIVARIKIPTDKGQTFLLRRLDTGAFSLTTMFRAAFSGANAENQLSGTWISPDIAQSLAKGYGISPRLVDALAKAEVNPTLFPSSRNEFAERQPQGCYLVG
ncbi:hypothetical protein K474DRAFT_1662650 [Panus rudis PR-1116 ss-1]|nr:hypothetical protein K474DRAFT_1662650 [Panus rudis PR-1116 ss-1]